LRRAGGAVAGRGGRARLGEGFIAGGAAPGRAVTGAPVACRAAATATDADGPSVARAATGRGFRVTGRRACAGRPAAAGPGPPARPGAASV